MIDESERAIADEKKKLRSLAASIAPTTSAESAAITATVREVLRRHEWTTVLTFLAMPGEVDLGGLRSDPALTLAVTRTPRTGPLTIHALEEPLERHRFGYLQPRPDAKPIASDGIEAVLVPGLLFARDGGRLGHGKGYYDELLSSLPGRPYLIGATVDRRVVDTLPMTDRDVWMDALATESGLVEVAP
ncbi:MAG TPA: 5-formyltetrahydrofolate cyclo-ligase [Acidimicrobiia bacterium]|nr:5-formyltetrahydrofolate cyclo-ligase [Acidimicrobiia bacterium]